MALAPELSVYNPALLVHEVDNNDWIHVAVVYENKTPSPYLDGTYVTSGLTSFKTVHPSAGRGNIYAGHTGGFGGGQNNGSPNFMAAGWMKLDLQQSIIRSGN